MREVLKKVISGFAILSLTLSSAAILGCNTTEGVGKDVENAGDALKDGARDAKD